MIEISNFMLVENILMRTVGVKHFLAIMKHLSDEFINLVAAWVLICFWVLVTNRSIFSSKGHIKVPEELKFPNACCVGIASQTVLSIYNPTDRWLQVSVGILSVSINGEKVRGFFKIKLNNTVILPDIICKIVALSTDL